MTILNLIWPYLLVSLSVVLFLVLAGPVLCKLFRITSSNDTLFSNAFIGSVLGLLIFVPLIALYYSRGNTVQLLILLPVLMLFLSTRRKIESGPPLSISLKQIGLRRLLMLLLAWILCFGWQTLVVVKLNTSFPFDLLEKDSAYYAEISRCLMLTGQENTFTVSNVFSSAHHYATPYHYFDLWFNGWISYVFGLNPLLTLYLVSYTTFSFLIVLGLLTIAERYEMFTYKWVFISFLLLFVSGLYISEKVLHLYNYQAQMEGIQERYGGKLSLIFAFAVASISAFERREESLGWTILLCMPVMYISLAPSIYGGSVIYLVLNSITRKTIQTNLKWLILLVLMLTGLFLFYFIQKDEQLNYRFSGSLLSYTDLTSISFFRIKYFLVELFLKVYAQPFLFVLNYLPFVVLIFMYRKKLTEEFKKPLLLFTIICGCGLLFACSVYLMDDAMQFYTNSLTLWHALFAVIILHYLMHAYSTQTGYMVSGIILIVLSLNLLMSFRSFREIDKLDHAFSQEYLLKVNQLISSQKTYLTGGIYPDARMYKNRMISYPLELYAVPFIYASTCLAPLNLTSSDEVPKENVYQINKAVKYSSFDLFYERIRKVNRNTSIEHARNLFIRLSGLNYLIIPKGNSPDLKGIVVLDRIKDNVSGQEFLLIK